MEALYASKFYKASKHKDAIKAAIENPINTELVTQLKSYLDDETLAKLKPAEEPKHIEVEPKDESENSAPASSGGPSAPHMGGGAPGLDDLGPEGEDEGVIDDVVEDFENGEPTQLDEVDEEVESAVVVTDDGLELGSDVDSLLSQCPDWVRDCISRTSTRHDDEYWIYFNDDTNLNKVMTPVIDVLDPQLQFNRLARANNAIVFEIDSSPIKTVDEVDANVNSTGEEK